MNLNVVTYNLFTAVGLEFGERKNGFVKVDRISNLPDPLLYHILSFLSTKEAVSTSVLSTRWRYLFASVSSLYLNDDFLWRHNKRTTIAEFLNFVDRVLVFNIRANIEKLHLKIGVDSSHVHSWISSAILWHGVRELHLCISNSKQSTTVLPSILFTSKTLVVLKLQIDTVLCVPSDVCLQNLKILRLQFFEFLNDGSLERLISSCVMLEDLVIYHCKLRNVSRLNICHPFLKRFTMIFGHMELSNSWIMIDAPSLVYLEYMANIAAGYSMKNLHSLVKANITLVLDKYARQASNFYCVKATELSRGLINVKSLRLSTSALKLLLCYEPLPLFEKLVKLKIHAYLSCCWENGIEKVLQSMPNLEKLAYPNEQILSYLPEEACSLSLLKTVEISLFSQVDQLENIKYFLKNAVVLEKLTVHAFSLNENEKLKITKELLASPRISKNCCILVV
ncbi:hypothetical protein PTKIN_Ptkin11bG0171800 [Pterospermum kingtungense]